MDTQLGGPSVDANSDSRRRSLYFKHSRDDQDKFLKMFDDADLLQCYRRSESIVPQQALALSNSGLVDQNGGEDCRADRGRVETMTRGAQTRLSMRRFETLLARPATDDEAAECNQFFDELEQLLPDKSSNRSSTRLRAQICSRDAEP